MSEQEFRGQHVAQAASCTCTIVIDGDRMRVDVACDDLIIATQLAEEMTEYAMTDLPQIYVTQNDLDRLLKLVEAQPGQRFEQLESELVRATVVPREEIPEDVVTMNSRVIFENETTGERREITLVYPASADIDAGRSRFSFRSERRCSGCA